ncbi:MAG: plasmid pRiA4b ORF-3 family protein, partial [Spirochaetes bacterium]|nr:plasmid pRiA4b ORF-3 family protein [Spirochaetota bacterium]
DLSARLQKGDIEPAWLPKHTFIVLSQIQGHTAALLEDLAFDEAPDEGDITAMENSLDSMIDTYSEIKELINSAMDNFRRSNLTVIHGGRDSEQLWRMIQINISGLDVWRRAVISHECTIEELHKLIQAGMGWKGVFRFRFYSETPDGGKEYLHDKIKLGDIDFRGKKELIYEYGTKWIVNVIIMSSYQPAKNETAHFIAGEGAAPPEHIDGPRHFKKLIAYFETGVNTEKQLAQRELGADFSGNFDLESANRTLLAVLQAERNKE